MSSFESQRPAASMRFTDGSRQAKFMRHEEKQENLARFCGYYLDRLSVIDAPMPIERSVTLLARSPQSPVARAVLDARTELAGLGISMRVLFAVLEPAEALVSWLDFAEVSAGSALIEIRWARRAALLDAHEQLVLGTGLSWAGDCMRREPEKRDAYEQFDTFDAAAAERATASFGGFWTMSERINARRASRTGVLSPAGAETVQGMLSGNANAPIVATRH